MVKVLMMVIVMVKVSGHAPDRDVEGYTKNFGDGNGVVAARQCAKRER
jgi:hypothetical protein